MTTKELLQMTGISEATLRRWLKEGHPVPELAHCERDWRGWRTWEERHIDAIRRYQKEKQRQQLGEASAENHPLPER
jgi:predicted site-specific integrase-resolvase